MQETMFGDGTDSLRETVLGIATCRESVRFAVHHGRRAATSGKRLPTVSAWWELPGQLTTKLSATKLSATELSTKLSQSRRRWLGWSASAATTAADVQS